MSPGKAEYLVETEKQEGMTQNGGLYVDPTRSGMPKKYYPFFSLWVVIEDFREAVLHNQVAIFKKYISDSSVSDGLGLITWG